MELVFGADAMLVDTRSRILEDAGFKVAKSTNVSETEGELNDKRFALLLLCHSLAPADCDKAIGAAIAINPNIVLLLLSAADRSVAAQPRLDQANGHNPANAE